jgi:hypothetical protein
MSETKITKQTAKKLLADVPEYRFFWCNDGRVFRNMKDLSAGLASMSVNTFAYHLNEDKNDFSNWLKDSIGDEQLAEDLENPISRREAAKTVKERVLFLDSLLS